MKKSVTLIGRLLVLTSFRLPEEEPTGAVVNMTGRRRWFRWIKSPSEVGRQLFRSLHRPIYSHRQEELVRLISPHFQSGDEVLDVGCGFGHLGIALMQAVPGARVEGLETVRRGGELIAVSTYNGDQFPWPDATFDVVILADMLHHTHNPERLLRESMRVSRRLVIVKDHLRQGIFAQQRISLLDWAANYGYGVQCLYRYNNLAEWRHILGGVLSAVVVEERTSLDIYPLVFNQFLGKGLHYFAVVTASDRR